MMMRVSALLGGVILSMTAAAGAAAPDPAPLPPNAGQVAKPRPAADFARLPLMEGPVLSPDGTLVAAKLVVGGKQMLGIVPVSGGAPRIIGAGDLDLNWWQWANDGWLVVGIGNNVSVPGTDGMYARRVLSISADGRKINKLLFHVAAQRADNVLWFADDGTPRILLAMQKSIYGTDPGFWPEVLEVDVSTGRSKRVVGPREGVLNWYADGRGVVRAGVGYSIGGRSSRLLYRAGPDDSFRTMDRVRQNEDRKLLQPAMFLADPLKALAYHDDADGFGGLYELDLTTFEVGAQVFSAKGFDVGGILPDRARSAVLAYSVNADYRRVHWMDPELKRVQVEIDRSVGGRRAMIESMTRDRQRLLVHVGGPDRPGGYYVFNQADGVLRRLAYSNDVLKGAALHPVRTIRYKARDGVEIAAILTLPKDKPASALPLIVMPHDGPIARDIEEWDWGAQFFADRGYAVVQPNYRGSSGYGTKFTELGEGQWGLAMQDDLNDALDHLAKQGIADRKRVCIAGRTYGGYAAMRAAQRDGALYRCAISFAGVSDLPRLQRYDRNFLMSGARSDWMKRQAPDLRLVSPINHPGDFSIPLLLVHGKKDTRVPVDHSREMAEKLRRAGKPVEYVEQPEGDHFFSRGEDRLQFLEKMEAFLEKHNPAG